MANKITHSFQIIGYTILAVLAADAIAFFFWALSGQHPVDNFFFGTITYHALQAILF